MKMRETRFAKRVVRRLLRSHSAISAKNPGLSGEPLYKEVLLDTGFVDPSKIDEILWQAADSIDLWTTHSKRKLGFRELAHYVVLSQHRAAGNQGAIVSFKAIVYSRIPAEL